MKIKYSPCLYNIYSKSKAFPNTEIRIIDKNTIVIDEEMYEFDKDSVEWQNITNQTNGVILEASRDDVGELWLTIRRFYTGDCSEWDNGEYHEMEVGDVP